MEETQPKAPGRGSLLPVGLIWLITVCAGIAALSRYSDTPGKASAATDWPSTSALARPGDRFFLVVFVHPKCPCSDATRGELDKLMARCQGRLAATVYFIKPDGMPRDW